MVWFESGTDGDRSTVGGARGVLGEGRGGRRRLHHVFNGAEIQATLKPASSGRGAEVCFSGLSFECYIVLL